MTGEVEGGGIPSQSKGSWSSFLKSIASFSGDLSALTAPAFILSTQSLVEFSAYWTENLDLFIAPTREADPGLRAVLVLKWLINTLKQQYSSRSEKLGSEKKPLNPFLGELFLGHWDSEEFGETRLISEQVSHHPPVTAYSIRNEKHGIHLQGYNGQKASFSNTIYVKQVGHALLTLTPPGSSSTETYLITLPELHIESLIYGTPFVELGKHIHIASSSGYISKIDFAGRGWISGKKNTFNAVVWKDGSGSSESKPLYSANGQWSGDFEIREGAWKSHGKVVDSFSLANAAPLVHLTVAPIQQQDVFESRRAWQYVARSIEQGDLDKTAQFKARIENAQRALRRKEQEENREWEQAFFTTVSSKDASNEKAFQQLAALLTSHSSVGSSIWDGGVAPDKTGGIWRLHEEKAATAKAPFHPDVGSSALGESAETTAEAAPAHQ